MGGVVFGKSRLLAGQPGAKLSLYVWLMGNGAVCLGFVDLADGCRVYPGSTVAATIQVVTHGRTMVGGIVDDRVKSVRVVGGTSRCTARVRRNGFVCVLGGEDPDAVGIHAMS